MNQIKMEFKMTGDTPVQNPEDDDLLQYLESEDSYSKKERFK